MILRLASMSIAVALAACSNSQGSSPVPLDGSGTHVAQHPALHLRNAASEAVIYSFGSKSPDGINPITTLTNVHGTLYGETTYSTEHFGRFVPGMIFTVTPSGNETVLNKVTEKQGGAINQLTLGPRPTGGGLALYGIGVPDNGCRRRKGCAVTVVRVTQAGAVVVIHDFGGPGDGIPNGLDGNSSLINVDGTFYGTTENGGTNENGTVFSVSPSGTEKVIYAFKGTAAQDGFLPRAGLVNLNGTLYGTTSSGGSGGTASECLRGGCGTVFSVTPSGTEHVLYSFKGGHDGAYPEAGLIAVNGTMYGTTFGGGTCFSYVNCGTVFSITPSGSEKVLHSFAGFYGDDGTGPVAALLELNGKMYGTTENGGSGTVFSITPSGTEKVLHHFTGGSDGAAPYGGLINIHTTLYGTTEYGGTYDEGTVYSITL